MAFTEDTTAFLDTDEFAVDVTVNGSTIAGIFDNGYEEQYGVTGSKPRVRCATADLPSITRGDAITVDGDGYTVANLEPCSPDSVFTDIVLESV